MNETKDYSTYSIPTRIIYQGTSGEGKTVISTSHLDMSPLTTDVPDASIALNVQEVVGTPATQEPRPLQIDGSEIKILDEVGGSSLPVAKNFNGPEGSSVPLTTANPTDQPPHL